ncbi:MAG TPA: nuclease-related domain-containing protein [Opitutaceae bacterium]|nr:nuclease-related domain-containing protein [Opitutaceae bacterium]
MSLKALQSLLHKILLGVKAPVLVVLLGFAPFVAALWIFYRRRARMRAQANESFDEFALRPPGESLRLRIDATAAKLEVYVFHLFAASCGAVVLTLLSPRSKELWVAAACAAYLIFAYARYVPKLFGAARVLQEHRSNFVGERLVGEELGRLRLRGYSVFHDVPFDGSNIDHILVGPGGVFAVTTKTRRRPAKVHDGSRAKVIYDGASLYFPIGTEARWVTLAKKNATHLTSWMSQMSGQSLNATALLTLPGWTVERRGQSEVNVLNPMEIAAVIESAPASTLAPDTIDRLSRELIERCRLKRESTDSRPPHSLS